MLHEYTFHTLSLVAHQDARFFMCEEMKPFGSIEIFTPGPSVAISMSCADLPIAGTATDWMSGGWLDIPLGSRKRLPEPIKLIFPFKTASLVRYSSSKKISGQFDSVGNGSEFFVVGMSHLTKYLTLSCILFFILSSPHFTNFLTRRG